MRIRQLLLIPLLIALFAPAAMAQVDCVDYGDTIQWLPHGNPGEVWSESILVAGDLLFLDDNGLAVYSLADPDVPLPIAELEAAGGPVALLGDRLVCLGDGVQLVDMSDPAAPVLLSAATERSNQLAADGDLAVGTYRSGADDFLRVYDLSNPAAIAMVAQLELPGIGVGVELAGSLAWVAIGGAGFLQPIDLSNPANPVLLAPYAPPYPELLDLELGGDRMYTVSNAGGYDEIVQVFDIDDPESPQLLGSLLIDTVSPRLELAGNRLYVVTSSGFELLDLSDDSAPTSVTQLGSRFQARALAATESRAYVVGEPDGFDGGYQPAWLRVADVSSGMGASPLGSLELGSDEEVVFAGGYAHVVGDDGYFVVDVADPAAPVTVGHLALAAPGEDMAIDGDRAYITLRVAYNRYDLAIVDFAEPTAPVLLGQSILPGDRTGGLAKRGDYLYLAANEGFAEEWTSYLATLNVSDPAAPVQEDYTYIGWESYGRELHVTEDGQHLIHARNFWTGGLTTFSLADPSAPQLVGSFPMGSGLMTIRGDGDLLLASSSTSLWGMGDGIISLLDISDPTQISAHATLRMAGPPSDFLVGGSVPAGYFYAGGDGLTLVSALDPGAPEVMDTYATPAHALADGGGFALGLAGGELRTLPYACSTTATETVPASRRTLSAVPNPFNPSTTLHFALTESGPVRLTLHDLAGRTVRTLLTGVQPAGDLRVRWDGRDERGRALASGVYLARLESRKEIAATKLLMLK